MIREEMVLYLIGVLPIGVNAQFIREEFDRLFCYQGYKRLLKDVGQERSEWLCMQIPVFDNISGALQSVAHVYFDSISRRTRQQPFTVLVRVAVITQSFANPPLPGQSLPAIPYPCQTNRLSMDAKCPFIHGQQSQSIGPNSRVCLEFNPNRCSHELPWFPLVSRNETYHVFVFEPSKPEKIHSTCRL